VAVVSHTFWQRHFDSDPGIVGRAITLNGRIFTIIGVAPTGFRGTEVYLSLDVWVPTMMEAALLGDSDRLNRRGVSWLEVLVKLKPGATMARAQADFGVVARSLAIGIPAALAGSRVLAFVLYDVSPTDPAVFLVVPAIVASVALAACYVPARRAMRLDPVVALKRL
jgi:hypothetical protein